LSILSPAPIVATQAGAAARSNNLVIQGVLADETASPHGSDDTHHPLEWTVTEGDFGPRNSPETE